MQESNTTQNDVDEVDFDEIAKILIEEDLGEKVKDERGVWISFENIEIAEMSLEILDEYEYEVDREKLAKAMFDDRGSTSNVLYKIDRREAAKKILE